MDVLLLMNSRWYCEAKKQRPQKFEASRRRRWGPSARNSQPPLLLPFLSSPTLAELLVAANLSLPSSTADRCLLLPLTSLAFGNLPMSCSRGDMSCPRAVSCLSFTIFLHHLVTSPPFDSIPISHRQTPMCSSNHERTRSTCERL